MHLKNIVRAVGEDLAGYVIGVPGVGTVTTLLSGIMAGLLPKTRFLFAKSYLDWELRDWPTLYKGETPLVLTYNGESLALPQTIILDNTVKRFPNSAIFITLDPNQFALPSNVKAKTEHAFNAHMRMLRVRRKRYANETNVRLRHLEVAPDSAKLVVQPVRYEDYIRTNLCLDADFRGQGLTLRKEVHADGKLESLDSSPLANNLGINILIFTSDGQLLIQERSRSVIVHAGEYGPSASGTVSFTDVSKDGIPLSRLPTFREAYEEIGFAPEDLPDRDLHFLGLTREFVRGGEPELFFCARTECSADDCRRKRKNSPDLFESTDLHFFDFGQIAFRELDSEQPLQKFHILVNKCIDQFGERMSIPLWTALALWKKWRIPTH